MLGWKGFKIGTGIFSSSSVYSVAGLDAAVYLVWKLQLVDCLACIFMRPLLKAPSLYGTVKSFIDVHFIFLIN